MGAIRSVVSGAAKTVGNIARAMVLEDATHAVNAAVGQLSGSAENKLPDVEDYNDQQLKIVDDLVDDLSDFIDAWKDLNEKLE